MTKTYETTINGVWFTYWYDRSLRLWTLLQKDAEDNQVGNAQYAPTRDILMQYATFDAAKA